MDEREKLRKFRELDDAFAEALRELEDPDSQLEIPTGPPVRPLEEQEEDDEAARQRRFEERLRALMTEYHQPADSVQHLLETLREMGRIA
ncbi:hypothetical protein [Halomonas sp. 3H]|uniref:hypothetical protein n=1 Tax=Halomonas sp. 3H TaxID=2952527 RepID=UPI0020B703ED|nr:hypothetical protein [Halomonas sp. 3H]